MKLMIDTDWFDAIKDLPAKKQKEIMFALLNYPDGDSDTFLWKNVIKPNLEKGKIAYYNKMNNLKQYNPQKTNEKKSDSDTDSDYRSESKVNINNIIENNNSNNIRKEDEHYEPKIRKEIKKSYGEMGKVKLSDDEVIKLKDLYKEKFDKAVEVLDNYLASKGDKYKSHYAVMKKGNWVFTKVVCGNTEEPKKWSPF